MPTLCHFLSLSFPLFVSFSSVFTKNNHMASQTFKNETSLTGLISSYKIVLNPQHLSLHSFQHESGFFWTCGPLMLCFVLQKPHPGSASQRGTHTVFSKSAALRTSFWQLIPSPIITGMPSSVQCPMSLHSFCWESKLQGKKKYNNWDKKLNSAWDVFP